MNAVKQSCMKRYTSASSCFPYSLAYLESLPYMRGPLGSIRIIERIDLLIGSPRLPE